MKYKKILTIIVVLLITQKLAFGQNNIFIGQYFQVLPTVAPGLTGANEFLDIRTGSRYQWVEYGGAPKTHFISVYKPFYVKQTNPHKYNSVPVSDMNPYKASGIKVGAGLYIFNDRSEGVRQMEMMLSSAVHVPVYKSTYLSLGISMGNYHTSLHFNNLQVLHPQNDVTYQNFVSSGNRFNRFKANVGLAAYSPRLYVSYSMMNAGTSVGEDASFGRSISSTTVHNIIGGYILTPWPQVEFIPNLYLRLTKAFPSQFDVGVRVRYSQNPYLGFSIRNNKTFVAMLGFCINDRFNFGYSYEYGSPGLFKTTIDSHEIILGFRLMNNKKYVPLW